MANAKFVFVVRAVLALVWLYNGLWDKILAGDPSSSLAQALGHAFPQQAPLTTLHVLGWTETLFAVLILSGFLHRFISWLQLLILLFIGVMGLLTNALHNPAAVIVTNLPLVMCILLVAFFGPGWAAIQFNKRKG
jgi:uncharacterized membrane protein YphA (DoxX/SURF4 family)